MNLLGTVGRSGALPRKYGAVLWLDAEDTSTSQKEDDNGADPLDQEVDLIYDKSGKGNNAVEIDDTRNFTLVKDGPRQVWDIATSDKMNVPALGELGTFICVFKNDVEVTNAADNGDFLRMDDAATNALKTGPGTSTLTDEIVWVAARQDSVSERSGWVEASGSIDNTDYHTLVVVFDSANDTYRFYLDGTLKTDTTTTHDILDLTSTVTLMGNSFDGKLAEMIVYNQALTSGQITEHLTYLNTKWRLNSFDLSNYKLQLPVNSSGQLTGDMHEIEQPALDTYNSAYFTQNANNLTFVCPDGGATSPGSDYARSELRELMNINEGSDNFQYTDSPPADIVTVRLDTSLATFIADKSLFIQQLHGGDTPWVAIYFRKAGGSGNTNLRTTIKDGQTDSEGELISESLNLKQITSDDEVNTVGIRYYQDEASGHPKLDIWLNGVRVIERRMYHTSGDCYFKRGAYYINDDGNGDQVTVTHWVGK